MESCAGHFFTGRENSLSIAKTSGSKMFVVAALSLVLPLLLPLLRGSAMASSCETEITVEPWGTVGTENVSIYTLKNKNNQEVDVLTYGATIRAIRTPDKNGKIDDVVLGFDDIEGYLGSDNPYFGATIGRVANRIAKARFTVDGVEYKVGENKEGFSLHGGFKGWNAKIWSAKVENDAVVMTLLSEDHDEGYPGAVSATTVFRFDNDGKLTIEMKASTTKATPINLTNHSYFNIAGHGTNASELYKHSIMLNADRWTVTDGRSIPTGEIRSVANSIMDLRNQTILGDVIDKVPGGGYDNNFCLPDDNSSKKVALVAKVLHSSSGRYLEVHSNQPGVQLYTSNFLPEVNVAGVAGKEGKLYFKHGALCLETQNYPDAVNQKNFPNSILRPGNEYCHVVTYKFGVQA